MDPQVGQLIHNKYRLVRLIGDGGMGSVFEAQHDLLGTTVALKFLLPSLTRRKGLVERFLQEAQVSARIDNIHVVRVSDVDRTFEGLAYMVMEYVQGETLQALYERNYQQGKRLSYGEAFGYMMQILDGVASAHQLSIVHRDLKPDNIMLTATGDGTTLVKILDFGIAKLKASGEVDRGLTRPGVVMGTPEYMAPEQAFSADKVDARADIFSLGVMFFEMLAGRRPVGGDNAHAIAAQYLEGGIAQLRDLAPSIDPTLAAVVHQAMDAEPSQRPETVIAFRDAIRPFAPAGAEAHRATPAALADTQDDPEVAYTPLGVAAIGSSVPLAALSDPTFDDSATPAGEAARPPTPADAGVPSGDAPYATAPDEAGVAIAHSAAPYDTPSDSPAPAAGAEPWRAGTEKMSDDALAAIRAGGDQAARPGGTVVGDEMFAAPPAAAGAAMELASPGLSPAPGMGAPGLGAPGLGMPATAAGRPRARRGGPSLLSILFLAGVVSAAVVGGVYFAHTASQVEDADDDPLPIATAQPLSTAQADLPPAEPPAEPPPTQPPIEPPTAKPPATAKTPPAASTTTKHPQPTAQPTAKPPPFVIPSALPPLPTALPSVLPPLFRLPPGGGPASTSAPPPSTATTATATHRRRVIIHKPQPKPKPKRRVLHYP